MIYSAYGVNYDNTITVGTSGTAAFPVLPWFPFTGFSFSNGASIPFGTPPKNLLPASYPYIEIRVGNTNTVSSATETVTITYNY